MIGQDDSGPDVKKDQWEVRVKPERLVWRLLQQFRQDMVWLRLLWGWQKWLDSECILRVESTEFADGLDMNTEEGKERRGDLGLNCWQDLLPRTEMRKCKKAVPASSGYAHLCHCFTNQICGVLGFDYDS